MKVRTVSGDTDWPGLDSPGEVEDGHQLAAQDLAFLEALGVEDDLCNEVVVRPRHGHRPEKLLQVVRKLLPPSIALPRRVHRDEDPRVGIQFHLDGD